jgi:CRISPR-associated endonuclease/helicase Cas3
LGGLAHVFGWAGSRNVTIDNEDAYTEMWGRMMHFITDTESWAKLERAKDGTLLSWHPLEAHCADVAVVCEGLLQHSILGRRLAALAGQDELDVWQKNRLAVFAAWHDLGKANHGFQARRDEGAPIVGHVREALCLLEGENTERQSLIEVLRLQRVRDWFTNEQALMSLLKASISHHGRPQSCGGMHYQAHLWRPKNGRDPIGEIKRLREATERWFPLAWQEGGRVLTGKSGFHHAFAGLLMLADWIASDCERFFPFADEWPDLDYMTRARRQAREALRQLGLAPRPIREQMSTEGPRFSDVSAYPIPRPSQKAVIELPLLKGGGTVILEAETGSGKTEAALLRFLALFKAGEVDGLYFALPTRTAATQMHQRVVEAAVRMFPNPEQRPAVVMAVPGYLQADDTTGTRLPEFKVLWPDDEGRRFRYKAWAAEHPKRYIAGCVVVGTIDQVLLSALAVDHSHLRATALLRHLLVVDEVHASDTYMTRLLREVLDHHLQAGGHAFLMSATLAAEARRDLLDLSKKKKPVLPLADCQNEAYPVLWHRPAIASDASCVAIATDDREKTVTIELWSQMSNAEEAACRALDAASQGAKVIVLRNTVTDCLKTQEVLEQEAATREQSDHLHEVAGQAAPHHSRYAREDRTILDQALEEHFGKDRKSGGRVAVATQTVQQSLDLDADLLITDLCPMDVLLQRIGRLHRHQRQRPAGFENARCVVLVPEDRDLSLLINRVGEGQGAHGLGRVYQDLRVIDATWQILGKQPRLTIPRDNRALVERALHSVVLNETQISDAWNKHAASVSGKDFASRQTARFNLCNWGQDFTELDFPPAGEKKIPTRLGLNDRRVVLDQPTTGPFGKKIRELTLPSWLANGLASEATPTITSAVEHTLHIEIGDKKFVYDRLGLRAQS